MKKKTIFILCMTSLLCFSSVQLFAQEQGDVNLSGGVDIVDALLIAQYYVGLNPVVFADYNADVNCSGLIDIVDALLVAQYYVGLIAGFSGCPDTPQPTPDETPDPTPDPTDFPEGTPNPYTSPIPTTGPTGWGTGIPTAIPETTPLPGTLSGDCVMNPETVNVARGDGFGISVLCNTGSQKLGGYIFTVTYDPRMIIVATDIGMNGVSAGPDGFVDSVEISNVRYNYSTLVISGTDASGRGPGASIEVCIINFRAKNLGTFVANLYVTELTDETGTGFSETRGSRTIGTIGDAVGFCSIEPPLCEVPFDVKPIFKQTIACNTGTQGLSYYEFEVTYDPEMVIPDMRRGINEAVVDSAGFTISADMGIEGKIKISGSSETARDPGILNLCSLKFITLTTGKFTIGLDVLQLIDESGMPIGNPRGFGTDVTALPFHPDLDRNEFPELIWTGENYGILWLNRKIYISGTPESRYSHEKITPYFITFDREGNRIGEQIMLDQEQYAWGTYNKNIIWNGNQYAYIWVGAPDSTYDNNHQSLILVTMDPSGNIKRRVVLVEDKKIDSGYQGLGIIWTGEEYLVVWRIISPTGNNEIYLTRIDAAGNRIQEDILIGVRPTINIDKSGLNNLSNFKAAFRNGRELKYLYFTKGEYTGMRNLHALSLDLNGEVKSDVLFTIDPLNYLPEAAIWNNGEYGCILYDVSTQPGHLHFARFDEEGNMKAMVREPFIYSSEYSCNDFSILAVGNEYVVNFKSNSTYDPGDTDYIRTYIISAADEILYKNENVRDTSDSAPYFPDIAWTGTGFGIVYRDTRGVFTTEPNIEGIFFSRLDSQAVKIGTDVIIVNTPIEDP